MEIKSSTKLKQKMGTGLSISETEYAKKVQSFSLTDLSPEQSDDLTNFLSVSHDFHFVFTSVTLDDFRQVMKDKPQNAIHLISHVSLHTTPLTFYAGRQSHV